MRCRRTGRAGLFVFAAWDGALRQESAHFGGAVDGAVFAGEVPAWIAFFTGTSTSNRTERLRIKSAGDLQMGGANTLISASRHPVLRAYAAAALPAASLAGQLIYISDGSGGKRLAISHGTDWRWPDGDVVGLGHERRPASLCTGGGL